MFSKIAIQWVGLSRFAFLHFGIKSKIYISFKKLVFNKSFVIIDFSIEQKAVL